MAFRNSFGERIFNLKYARYPGESWEDKAKSIVDSVCGPKKGLSPLLHKDEIEKLCEYITQFKFLPGGRYIYYAGRNKNFWNNCFLFRAEDTREGWADLVDGVTSCHMSGGGIGVDYSNLRSSGRLLKNTGGVASGPIPLMHIVNEIGRNVMQGGSRRSAIYGSLNWKHSDIEEFLIAKNWHNMPIKGATKKGEESFTLWDAKQKDFNFPCPLDMTNISVNYDNEWLHNKLNPIFLKNVQLAMMSGEPGFSFNFLEKENETLRNPLNLAA